MTDDTIIVKHLENKYVTVHYNLLRQCEPLELMFYVWLKMHAIRKHTAFPSIIGASIDMGCSRKTLERLVSKMQKNGRLVVTKKKGMTSTYDITWYDTINTVVSSSTSDNMTHATKSTMRQNVSGRCDKMSQGDATNCRTNDKEVNDKEVNICDAAHAAITRVPVFSQKRSDTKRNNQAESSTVFDQDAEITRMRSDKRKHVRIIGRYLTEKRKRFGTPDIESDEHLSLVVAEHLKAAKRIADGIESSTTFASAMYKAFEKCGDETTVHTITKYLTK